MPLTPLHYPVAYIFYKLNKGFSLPGLAVGSMFPDLEIPAIILLFGTRIPHRVVLHSLLGAATLGTMLSVIFTVLIYPPLTSGLIKIDKNKVEGKCRLSSTLFFSCLLGNLSHVLLDVVNHPHNPLFWPFSLSTPSPICLALGGMENASLIAYTILTILIVLFAALLIGQRRVLWEKLLVGE
ncbi:MAG: DUF4184 family protein [Candidatus Bathyarchaeia archaeon]